MTSLLRPFLIIEGGGSLLVHPIASSNQSSKQLMWGHLLLDQKESINEESNESFLAFQEGLAKKA